ncbi:hypothetical protein KKH3_21380 [Pectobacterium actinidiae]|nr:hypothetical protein KKH3_21380 [Pectobacterium actinidiae]
MWLCASPIAANRLFFIFTSADIVMPKHYNKAETQRAKDKSRVTR